MKRQHKEIFYHLEMFKKTNKLFSPQISQCLSLKYLSDSVKPLLTSTLSLKIENKEARRLQKAYLPECFYSSQHEGGNETTSYSKSQGDCNDPQKNWPSKSRRQYRFHPDTEKALNHQINSEFNASYHYLSMAAYFGRVDVALPGCESYFTQMQKEEHDHATKLINYIKSRGGSVTLCPINPPDEQNWQCPLHAFQTALNLEIEITDSLVALHRITEKHYDLSASDFIVTNFMDEQMKSINQFARFVTVLSNIGDQGLGQFIFDKDLLKNYVAPEFNVLRKGNSHLKIK